jgi:hypothetical protein
MKRSWGGRKKEKREGSKELGKNACWEDKRNGEKREYRKLGKNKGEIKR